MMPSTNHLAAIMTQFFCAAKRIRAPLLVVGVATFAFTPSHAGSLRDFFANANLVSLAHGDKVLILEAQNTGKVAQADVNSFDDFFLLDAKGTLFVNFDNLLKLKDQRVISRLIGPEIYSNHDIPAADLQDGFNKVKQNFSLNAALVGHVSIYRALNPSQPFVYDYAISKQPGSAICQEYLYAPAAMSFQKGSPTTPCSWTLRRFGIVTQF